MARDCARPGVAGTVWSGGQGPVRRWQFEAARFSAALAVSAIIAGWALAQNPTLLPGLTIAQAAAPHDTLVAVVVAVIAGGALLFPSLGLLFSLVLGGRLDRARPPAVPKPGRPLLAASAPGLMARAAGACLLAGIGLLTIAEAAWAHAVGVAALLGFIAVGFLAIAPADLARLDRDEH